MKQFLFTLLKKMDLAPKWKSREILVGDQLLSGCNIQGLGTDFVMEWQGAKFYLGCTVLGTPDLFAGGIGLFSRLERMPVEKLDVLLKHPRLCRDLRVNYKGDTYVVQKPYSARPPLQGDFFICDLVIDEKRIRSKKPMMIPARSVAIGFYSDKAYEESDADLYSEMAEILFSETKSKIKLGVH